jgi:hypothetical protein
MWKEEGGGGARRRPSARIKRNDGLNKIAHQDVLLVGHLNGKAVGMSA